MKCSIIASLLAPGMILSLGVAVQAEIPEEFRVEFQELYVDEGIEPAVSEGVRLGMAAYIIMEAGLGIPDLNPQDLVKAMYCAGITGADIRGAAEKLGVTDQLVVSGFSKSIGECEAWLVGGFIGLPVPSGGGVFASTSTFAQN